MAGQQTQQDRQRTASPNYTEAQTNAVIAKAKANLKATGPYRAPKPPKAGKKLVVKPGAQQNTAVQQAQQIGGIGAG